jgi:hypothetical protein
MLGFIWLDSSVFLLNGIPIERKIVNRLKDIRTKQNQGKFQNNLNSGKAKMKELVGWLDQQTDILVRCPRIFKQTKHPNSFLLN